jgi:hypothetical protein
VTGTALLVRDSDRETNEGGDMGGFEGGSARARLSQRYTGRSSQK